MATKERILEGLRCVIIFSKCKYGKLSYEQFREVLLQMFFRDTCGNREDNERIFDSTIDKLVEELACIPEEIFSGIENKRAFYLGYMPKKNRERLIEYYEKLKNGEIEV